MKTKSRCLLQKQLQQEQAQADAFRKMNRALPAFLSCVSGRELLPCIFECVSYLPALLQSYAKIGSRSSVKRSVCFIFSV